MDTIYKQIRFNGFQNSDVVLNKLRDAIQKRHRYDFLHLTTSVRVYGFECTALLVAYKNCLELLKLLDYINYLTCRINSGDYAEEGTDACYVEDELNELVELLDELYTNLVDAIINGFGEVFFTLDDNEKNPLECGEIFRFEKDVNLERVIMYFRALKGVYLERIDPMKKIDFSSSPQKGMRYFL